MKLLQLTATILMGSVWLVEKALHDPLTWLVLGAAVLARLAIGLRPPR